MPGSAGFLGLGRGQKAATDQFTGVVVLCVFYVLSLKFPLLVSSAISSLRNNTVLLL